MNDPLCSPDGAPTARSDDDGLLDPRAILTSIGEVVYNWDIPTDRLSWGSNLDDVLPVPPHQGLDTGRTFAAFVEPGSGLSRHDAIMSLSGEHASGGAYRTRYGLRTRADTLLTVEDSGRWFPGSDGRPASAHGVVRIVRPGAHVFSETDTQGGGVDRSLIIAELAVAITHAVQVRRPVTIMVAAIDDLPQLNETIGYEATDALFAVVTERLQSAMRSRDRLTRYGGNRFALLLASCPPDQAAVAAGRFVKAARKRPVDTTGGPVDIAMTIGSAIAPQDSADAAALLRHAEEALADAKHRRMPHVAYSRRLEREPGRRADGARLNILAALNERRVRIARQPVVEARSRRHVFDEVLVRIAQPDGTIVAAAEVVPDAERLGLIRLVDQRVLELAIACLVREPLARLAINVSALTLNDADWLPTFAAHLGAHPGVADRLIVEVTETAAIENVTATRALLAAVKALGVSIAIDDFGAGYTSFRHLRDFAVDIIKIDGAFVQNLSRSTDDRFFVRALVELARQLDVAVVAEWVEDEPAAALLAQWGVDYLQGDAVGGAAEIDGVPLQAASAG